MILALGFLAVVQLILTIAAIGTSIYAATRKRSKPREGETPAANPSQRDEPIPAWYGQRLVTPPEITSYLIPDRLNDLEASTRAAGAVRVLNLGYGPLKGSDLEVIVDRRPVRKAITLEDGPMRLTPLDAARTRWAFPLNDVQPGSIAIYFGGTLVAAAKDAGVFEEAPTFVRRETDAIRIAASLGLLGTIALKDSSLGTGTRFGARLDEEYFDGLKVEAVLNTTKLGFSIGTKHYPQTEKGPIVLAESQWRIGTADDGTRYLWLPDASLLAQQRIVKFLVSGKAYARVEVEESPGGRLVVVFDEDPTGGSGFLEATGNVAALGGDIGEPRLYRGVPGETIDLPSTGRFPRSIPVGEELVPFAAISYVTEGEVDDLHVHVHAIGGFFGQGSDIRGTTVHVQIRVRREGAADAETPDKDPANGWVTLANPKPDDGGNADSFGFHGKLTRGGQWVLSIADLLRHTRRRKNFFGGLDVPKPGTGSRLFDPATLSSFPVRAKYEVELRRLDEEGSNNAIELAIATEITNERVSFPGQGVLVLPLEDAALLRRLVQVSTKAREVVVPSATAELVEGPDGRTVPYEIQGGVLLPSPRRWTRNPAWIAIDYYVEDGFATPPAALGYRKHHDWADVDLAAARAFADWCDEQAKLDDGSTEARSECDAWLTRSARLGEDLTDLLAGSGGAWTTPDGKLSFLIDRPSEPVTPITADDFAGGQVQLVHVPTEGIPTELRITHPDERKRFDEIETKVREGERDLSQRESPESLRWTCVRRVSQVHRQGKVHLAHKRLEPFAIEGAAWWRLLLYEVGDVVPVTCPDFDLVGALYRVARIQSDRPLRTRVFVSQYDPAVYSGQAPAPAKVAQVAVAVAGAPPPGAEQPAVTAAPGHTDTITTLAAKQGATWSFEVEVHA